MGASGWNPFDWSAFENFFGGKLPGDPKQLSWISDYVNDVMRESFNQSGKQIPGKTRLPAELFQTHNHVIVRFTVPSSMKAKNLRVYAGMQKVRIEGLPNDGKQIVALPAIVLPNTCRATFKDGVLQVKIQKRKWSEQFEEIYIRYP